MSNVNSWKLVGLGSAVVVAGFASTFGCSSSGDNSARTGAAGAPSGGTATGTAGTLGSSGGTAGTTPVGTAGTSSGGTTPIGGAGGTTGTAGGSTGGVSTTGCDFPTTTAASALLYSGATTAPNCGSSIAMPHAGYWFKYGDATVGATNTGAGQFGGCDGPADCAFHTTGMGYTDYGAGVGFDLNDDAAQAAQPFDATPYMGLQFWAKGTITGTRGPKYAQIAQEIHIKLVTSTDRHGDDYGSYCVIGADWTKCSLAFTAAARDGFSATPDPTTDKLDLTALLKIQLEFSKFSQSADAGPLTPVAFDVLVDNVSFF